MEIIFANGPAESEGSGLLFDKPEAGPPACRGAGQEGEVDSGFHVQQSLQNFCMHCRCEGLGLAWLVQPGPEQGVNLMVKLEEIISLVLD